MHQRGNFGKRRRGFANNSARRSGMRSGTACAIAPGTRSFVRIRFSRSACRMDCWKRAEQQAVVRAVHRELLTPVGLRTLERGDPDYQPRYEGAPEQRDAAYHQGTVWPWLLGPFIDAYLNACGSNERNLAYCRGLVERLKPKRREARVRTRSRKFTMVTSRVGRGDVLRRRGAWRRSRGSGRPTFLARNRRAPVRLRRYRARRDADRRNEARLDRTS